MNKIYKVVWNTVRNCYVVGSELISSKSGRHSTSNGKSSSLKVTLTVLALCGMTALGSGVAPAYAADADTAVESQYVAVLVNSNNNYYTSRGHKVQYGNERTFDGYTYHKETVSGETYWVRNGYTIKYEENERYPGARKDNIIKAYKTSSYTADSDAGLLKSNQIMVELAGISTLTGVDLDDVSGGTYVGATNSGSTSTPSSFNYMIKDDNGTYIDAGGSNYRTHFAAATKNSDGTYSYNGEVLSNDNLYVISSTDRYGNTTNKVGVFLTSSGKVYTGKVFGANNEVLMTTKSAEGTMYSYWGADTPDPNTKLADMTIGQFNQALEKVNNNSKAVAGDTIKEIKTTAKTDGGTIDLVRRGQYNSATGQYEGEYTVGKGITITSHGGTNGEDVKINFSNGTTGFDVAAGSNVEAAKATESAPDITGLKINGETYNIKTGQTYTAGNNVNISNNVISASNNYVSFAKLNNYDELILEREGLGNLTVDLSGLTRGLSSTDYQLVENKNSSDKKYKVSNGEVTLTVKDMNNLSNKDKTITISGLAGQEDLTHYFSVNAPMTNPLNPLGNYNNKGAQGERSIAIGVKASATGRFSVAIGSGQNDAGSTASGDYATAVGNGSLAKGADSTALGYNATALGKDSVAIGYTSIANGENSMALGVEARAGNNGSQANYATAVGALAHVDAVDGTALGQNAEVDSEKGTALGSTSKVHAVEGTAIGAYTSVTAKGGVAIGQESVADRAAGVKGYNPLDEASNTPTTWTATDGAVSLGSDSDGSSPHTRQITNLAAGTADTDAVNVAQLKNTKIAITNEYTKYVADKEDYVTSGSISNGTITLKRALGGEVTINGLKDYVEGLDSYVTSASLKDNKLTITQNNDKGTYVIDLSGFANQFSSTDYRVVANPAKGSNGIYKPDANGNIALTVQDPKTGATSTVQLSDVASATTVTKNYNTLNTKVDAAKTTLANGKNTTVEYSTAKDGHIEYKVNLNKNIDLTKDGSLKIGDTELTSNGLAITNGPSITTEGINAGSKQIHNVYKGTADTDAVNLSQLNEIKNAGTNGGFGLTVDNGDSVKKNLGETVTVKGDGTNITTKVDNGTIKVELNKNINLGNDGSVTAGNTTINNKGVDTNQVKVGDITITKDGINGGKQQITNIGSGLDGKTYATTVSGQENWNNAASIGDVHTIARDEAGKAAEAVKAKSGKNITVDTDNRVNLNDDITLGTNSSKQVKVDGTNGRVVIGSGNTAVTLGQQSNTSGDSNPAEGNYLTGLDNKNWDASYIQSGRAATEDQLKAVDDKVSSGRKFTGDDGKQLTVALGQNLSLTGGAQTDNLSDGNIGVVKNGESGLSVKLSKDLTSLNSVTIKTSDADRTISIADGNVNMGGNTVSGVADGQVAPGSTDAVNGSQLYATNQKVTANTENINNLTQTVNNNTESISTLNQTVDNHTESINILTDAVVTNAENINSLSHSLNKLDSRINRVGAGAAALAALHPLDFDPDNKWDFAAGYGNYAGANAVAIGTYYRPNENTMFSIGGSFGGGENMINAGVSFKLGSGGSGITTSKTVMAKKIKEQDELLKAQDAKMKEQDEKIAKLEALVAQQGEMIQQALGKK